MGNFRSSLALSKIVLTLDMLIGQAEIFPIIMVFGPETWKKVEKQGGFATLLFFCFTGRCYHAGLSNYQSLLWLLCRQTELFILSGDMKARAIIGNIILNRLTAPAFV